MCNTCAVKMSSFVFVTCYMLTTFVVVLQGLVYGFDYIIPHLKLFDYMQITCQMSRHWRLICCII